MVAVGVIDIKTAFELVIARAKAMENEVGDNIGNMVAMINLGIEKVKAICKKFGAGKVAVTNYNAFNQIVVSVAKEIFDKFMSGVKSAKASYPTKSQQTISSPDDETSSR